MKHSFVLGLLIAAACGIAVGAPAAAPERHEESVILVGGQDAGSQTEETVREGGQIRDLVEQTMVLNRLGSRMELRSRDLEIQDARGRLTGGHYESTMSKSTVTTDVTVKAHSLMLTTTSGGKSYTRELPFTGELLGSAGERALLANARNGQVLSFKTFVADMGAVVEVSMRPQGHERLTVDAATVDTLKLEYRVTGVPSVTYLWVDAQGYTVRAQQDTPLGAFELRRGKPAPADANATQLPPDSFEGTLALSNIRLPQPRRIEQLTLEISSRDAAGIDWPDLAGGTQRVLKKTPQAVVLEVSQSPVAAQDGNAQVAKGYLAPSPLLQSDDEVVKEIAAAVAGSESDPWKVALALQRWVARHMEFDAGIAVAPAGEVARDQHGTCVGYAVLLASLARAQHIPSRLVMGYVYEGRVWGGHAWTELWIAGQWRAVDAAEYAPGLADAARFAVIRDSGETGTVADIGKLAALFAKINVRTLSYRLGGKTVEVAPAAPDHTIAGNLYSNPWLGLSVVKPQAASFTALDSHWPQPPALVRVKQGATELTVSYFDADTPVTDLLSSQLSGIQPPGTVLTWQGLHAIRVHSADGEALAAKQGDGVWLLVAHGQGAHALMESLLPSVSLTQEAAAAEVKDASNE